MEKNAIQSLVLEVYPNLAWVPGAAVEFRVLCQQVQQSSSHRLGMDFSTGFHLQKSFPERQGMDQSMGVWWVIFAYQLICTQVLDEFDFLLQHLEKDSSIHIGLSKMPCPSSLDVCHYTFSKVWILFPSWGPSPFPKTQINTYFQNKTILFWTKTALGIINMCMSGPRAGIIWTKKIPKQNQKKTNSKSKKK